MTADEQRSRMRAGSTKVVRAVSWLVLAAATTFADQALSQSTTSDVDIVREGDEEISRKESGLLRPWLDLSLSSDLKSDGQVVKVGFGEDLLYSELRGDTAFSIPVDFEGSAATASEGRSYASLRIAPTIAGFFEKLQGLPSVTDLKRWHAFADIRGRYGEFQEDPGSQATSPVRQLLVGVGVGAQLPFGKHGGGEFSARRYSVAKNFPDEATLPDELKSDVTQAELSLTYGRSGAGLSISVEVKAVASWPDGSEFEDLVDASVKVGRKGSEVKSLFRYRNGTEGGLEFDKELLVGLALELLK